jgi:acetyl esterase/lipase
LHHIVALLLITGSALLAQTPTVEGFIWASPNGQDQKADLYLPKGDGPFPVAVYIHGGGWTGGDRKQLKRQAAHMAEKGVAGFAIDYRLAPTNPYPAAWEDSRAAVKWVRDNAAKYHFDITRIAAVGSSAGGNLVGLLGTSGEGESRVDAVVAFNPALDLSDTAGQVRGSVEKFLGGSCAEKQQACKDGSPVMHVHPGMPPFLILHGTTDPTVPYAESTHMVVLLKAAGNQVELFSAEGGVHAFWATEKWYAPTEKAMETFLLRVLAK